MWNKFELGDEFYSPVPRNEIFDLPEIPIVGQDWQEDSIPVVESPSSVAEFAIIAASNEQYDHPGNTEAGPTIEIPDDKALAETGVGAEPIGQPLSRVGAQSITPPETVLTEESPQVSEQDEILPPAEISEIEKAIAEVQALDSELLEHAETRQLVELGAQFGTEVTEDFGTPEAPKWASGTTEREVIMTYHNGGEDGHTSLGPFGAGVPRNVLVIAKAVNEAASERAGEPMEVYDPTMRATSFYAAEAHDNRQLCGRALLLEGQGEGHGDERLSAEDARDRYLASGGNPEVAQEIYNDVMATAFNPLTGTQNVDYDAWRANPDDPALTRAVLGQELTAAGDLLGPAGPRGPLGAIEDSLERLCHSQKDHLIPERLRAIGVEPASITTPEQLLNLIGQDEILLGAFTEAMAGQSKFFTQHLKYSDEAIRRACGKGIDELFPGRLQNGAMLDEFTEALRAGVKPLIIWQRAKILAGY